MLPPPSAGPSQVREYISHILISKHDATPDLALQIANRWQLRRPIDLRLADVNYFNHVFGHEAGLLLFRTVREDVREEWYASPMGIVCYWAPRLLIILAVAFSVQAYLSESHAGTMASIKHTCLVLGPPMLFCGVWDSYGGSSHRLAMLLCGLYASIGAVALYVAS